MFKSKFISLVFIVGFLLVAIVAYAQPFAYISATAYNNVGVIDTATNAVVANIPVGDYPYGVAVNPSGTMVYVANHSSDTVSVINTASNTVTANIGVNKWPTGIAVTPTGTKVYVTHYGYNNVSVIDTATNTMTATITVGEWPIGVAVNPSGTMVYVANLLSDTVSVINTATDTVIKTIRVGDTPLGVAIDFTGTLVYVANHFSSTISVIDTATNAVIADIDVVKGPVAFGQFIVPTKYNPFMMHIDIKPGRYPNCFNSDSHGVIPVAIYGSENFDVTILDPSTVQLDGQSVSVKGKSGNIYSYEDVNKDGNMDLVVQIVDDGLYTRGTGIATLTAVSYDGVVFQGQDFICITQ